MSNFENEDINDEELQEINKLFEKFGDYQGEEENITPLPLPLPLPLSLPLPINLQSPQSPQPPQLLPIRQDLVDFFLTPTIPTQSYPGIQRFNEDNKNNNNNSVINALDNYTKNNTNSNNELVIQSETNEIEYTQQELNEIDKIFENIENSVISSNTNSTVIPESKNLLEVHSLDISNNNNKNKRPRENTYTNEDEQRINKIFESYDVSRQKIQQLIYRIQSSNVDKRELLLLIYKELNKTQNPFSKYIPRRLLIDNIIKPNIGPPPGNNLKIYRLQIEYKDIFANTIHIYNYQDVKNGSVLYNISKVFTISSISPLTLKIIDELSGIEYESFDDRGMSNSSTVSNIDDYAFITIKFVNYDRITVIITSNRAEKDINIGNYRARYVNIDQY